MKNRTIMLNRLSIDEVNELGYLRLYCILDYLEVGLRPVSIRNCIFCGRHPLTQTEREEANRLYAKYCFDCDVQMDSCVLVGFYVFRYFFCSSWFTSIASAIIIVLKQVIKVTQKRFQRWKAQKMAHTKFDGKETETEMMQISL